MKTLITAFIFTLLAFAVAKAQNIYTIDSLVRYEYKADKDKFIKLEKNYNCQGMFVHDYARNFMVWNWAEKEYRFCLLDLIKDLTDQLDEDGNHYDQRCYSFHDNYQKQGVIALSFYYNMPYSYRRVDIFWDHGTFVELHCTFFQNLR